MDPDQLASSESIWSGSTPNIQLQEYEKLSRNLGTFSGTSHILLYLLGCLLITFANSLNPHQAQSGSKLLNIPMVSLKEFLKKLILIITAEEKKHETGMILSGLNGFRTGHKFIHSVINFRNRTSF